MQDIYTFIHEKGFHFEPVLNNDWGEYEDKERNKKIWWIGKTISLHNGNQFTIMTFGDWKTGEKHVYTSSQEFVNGEAQEIQEAIQNQAIASKELKKALQEKTAIHAQKKWEQKATDEYSAEFHCPYLTRKGLAQLFGARVDKKTRTKLLIPCTDIDGKIWGLQTIFPTDNVKKFMADQKVSETFFLIGQVTDKLYITEGFATGASVHLATNAPVAVAFNARNLKNVAAVFRKKYPSLAIIIAGDNNKSGIGQSSAKEAAELVKGFLIIPPGEPQEPKNQIDWNDCWVESADNVSKIFRIFDEEIKKKANKLPRNRLNLQKLSDLFTQPDAEYDWLIDQLLIKGGTSSLSGLPKSGKSTLNRKMCLAISKGEPFFGRATKKGKIVYIAVEEKVAQVKRHFKDLGADGSEDIYIHAAYTPEKLAEQLIEVCKTIKPDLIVCDTFQKTTGCVDLNDAVKINMAMAPFHDISMDYDTHILFITHLKKGGTGADAIAGSVALRGAFDCNMILESGERKKKRRVFYSEQRYGLDFPPHVVEFDEATRNPTLGASTRESGIRDILEEIIIFIRNEEEECSSNAMFKEIKGKRNYFSKALKIGVEKGYLVERKAGQKKFYNVTNNAPPEEEDPY